MRALLPGIQEATGRHLPSFISLPGIEQFYVALLGATILPFFLILFATAGRPSRVKSYLAVVLAGVLLLNVFLPHVPAAVVLGGYAPGVATAVLLNLPFSVYFFRRSLHDGRISRRGLMVSLAVALAVLLLAIPLLYLLARLLTGS